MSLTSSRRAAPAAILFILAQVVLPTAAATAVHGRRGPQLDSRQIYAPTAQGCYSSAGGGMRVGKSSIYQSSGQCETTCTQLQKPVMALQDDNCFCGDLLPSPSSRVSTSACSSFCPGYDAEPCGGPSAYTVWLTGVDDSVGSVSGGHGGGDESTSAAPSSSTIYTSSSTPTVPTHTPTHTPTPPKHHFHPKPNTDTSHKPRPTRSAVTYTTGKTVVKTVPAPSGTSQPDSQSGSSNSPNGTTIGIAVGVVAGVLLLVGIVAGVLFYLRRRRRLRNAENGHRRADSLNAFVAAGGHVPGSMASRVPTVTINDTRLDPRMMQETRRASAGSYLADNEDYSRRILKVTNPDGT